MENAILTIKLDFYCIFLIFTHEPLNMIIVSNGVRELSFLWHNSHCHYCTYYLLKLDLICGLDFWELLFLALLHNHTYSYAK